MGALSSVDNSKRSHSLKLKLSKPNNQKEQDGRGKWIQLVLLEAIPCVRCRTQRATGTPLLFKESSPPLCREPLEPFLLSWSSCPWDLWPSQIQTQTTMTTKTTTNMQNFQLSPYRSLLPTTLQIQQCPQIE